MAYREFVDRKEKDLEDARQMEEEEEGKIMQEDEVEDDAGEGPSRGWATASSFPDDDEPPNGVHSNSVSSNASSNGPHSDDNNPHDDVFRDDTPLDGTTPPDETALSDGSPVE